MTNSQNNQQDDITYVLIPGAGHGAWSWQPVADRLVAAGHRVLPLTLPGMGVADSRSGHHLDDAAAHVVSTVTSRGLSNVKLVAHSLGGIVMAAAANQLQDQLSELVYVSAYVPVPGQSMNDANPEFADATRTMIEETPDQTVTITLEQVKTFLFQDVPEVAQKLLHGLLVPTPGGYFLDPYHGSAPAAFGIRGRYILPEHDRGLALPGADLAARAGTKPRLVPGTHEALLTHPDDIVVAMLSD